MAFSMEKIADHLHGFTYNGRRWTWSWMYPGLFSWRAAGIGLITAEFDSAGELVFQFAPRDGEAHTVHVVTGLREFQNEPPSHQADYVMGAVRAVSGDILRERRKWVGGR